MIFLDKTQNKEQNRNKYLQLRLDLAKFWQPFAGLSPERRNRRGYFHFNNLFQEVCCLRRLFAHGSFIAMQPDIDKYLPFFDKFDLTREQKINYIHIMWKITGAIAYRAFGLDSAQLAHRQTIGKVGSSGNSLIELKDRSLCEIFGCHEINID